MNTALLGAALLGGMWRELIIQPALAVAARQRPRGYVPAHRQPRPVRVRRRGDWEPDGAVREWWSDPYPVACRVAAGVPQDAS